MNITPIEKNGQRVLTTSQLAESFGTEAIKIQQNFNNNKDRYTEGKHFFLLQGDDLKSLKGNLENFEVASNINRLYLWTEKGAWLHAKSLNTDQAWEAYESLVDDYYRLTKNFALPQNYKEALVALVGQVEKNEVLETEKLMLQQQVREYEPKATYLDRILQSKDTVSITQIAKDYGLSGQQLNQILHEDKVQYKLNGQWLLYQKHQDKGYTKSQTIDVLHNSGERTVKMNTKWSQKGRLFIHELLSKREIIPSIDREHDKAQ